MMCKNVGTTVVSLNDAVKISKLFIEFGDSFDQS
jgi:hypothetical protein